jgi:hypothetical protein
MAAAAALSDADMAKLFKNPAVQDAMKAAGEDALKSPEVQDMLIKKAKETMTPENAAIVANKAKEWAQDPEVQAKARYAAGMAMEAAGALGQKVMGCIEQGPAGVRFLSFLGGVASAVAAIIYLIAFHHFFQHPIEYMQCVFKVGFGLSTSLFELPPEYMQKVPFLNKYQDMLMKWCAFLTLNMGRGLFYFYQGISWLILFEFGDIIDGMVGVYMMIIGILHILMHFGIMPSDIAAKMKTASAKAKGAYQQVNASSSSNQPLNQP